MEATKTDAFWKAMEESGKGQSCVNRIELIVLGLALALPFPGSLATREALPAATADS